MAGETYYFFFSIILVLGALLQIVNILYFRVRGKTILGEKYEPNTPEYERLNRIVSTRNLVIAAVLASVFIANLAYEVIRIVHLPDLDYAHAILVYAPVSTVLFFIVMIFIVRNMLKSRSSKGR